MNSMTPANAEVMPIVNATCFRNSERTCPTTWLRSCSPPDFCLVETTESQAAPADSVAEQGDGNGGQAKAPETEPVASEGVECLGGLACAVAK